MHAVCLPLYLTLAPRAHITSTLAIAPSTLPYQPHVVVCQSLLHHHTTRLCASHHIRPKCAQGFAAPANWPQVELSSVPISRLCAGECVQGVAGVRCACVQSVGMRGCASGRAAVSGVAGVMERFAGWGWSSGCEASGLMLHLSPGHIVWRCQLLYSCLSSCVAGCLFCLLSAAVCCTVVALLVA